MIRHNHVSSEVVVPEFHTFADGLHHDLGDVWLSKVHRTAARGVQFAVHPYECLAGRERAGWCCGAGRQAAVEMPCQEESGVFGVLVGEAALGHSSN
jgi:hypothetical protein